MIILGLGLRIEPISPLYLAAEKTVNLKVPQKNRFHKMMIVKGKHLAINADVVQ